MHGRLGQDEIVSRSRGRARRLGQGQVVVKCTGRNGGRVGNYYFFLCRRVGNDSRNNSYFNIMNKVESTSSRKVSI